MPEGSFASKPTWWNTSGCSATSAFLSLIKLPDGRIQQRAVMEKPTLSMAQQIAQTASASEQRRTGHMPQAVSVVLSEETLVITLHGALSPAEKALAKTAAGAAQVQEFHRQLFANSSQALREEIKRITGVEVREAIAEVEPATGSVVQVFTTGTMVQVFLLDHSISPEVWNGVGKY
jgi:uncharacterized protein YbcI